MSLADELVADLEEGGLEQSLHAIEEEGSGLAGDDDDDMDIDFNQQGENESKGIKAVARLICSAHFKYVMDGVDKYETDNDISVGLSDADPQYKLIVDANNLAMEIDNEITIIHKFCRDNYAKRFPELDSLVPTPMEFIRTVKELGNDLEKYKNNEVLQQVISNATIMIVSVTASTTQGQVLTEDELNRIFEACDMADDLVKARLKILAFVESKMIFIAPNTTAVIGASVAARLLGAAGGLDSLVRMPSCNIMLLGTQKRSLSGFSSAAVNNHTGFIYHSDLVQKMPADLRKKAARLVSAKITLAARVDSSHDHRNGNIGLKYKEEISTKFEKWQEPPPVKQVKALPAPIEPSRKKRGGRRYRNMKERLGMTEMHKQANRTNFGEIEDDAYQDSIGYSLGQLGKRGSGRIRAAQVDNKTQVRISKTLQNKIQKANRISGMQSSISKWGGKSTVRDRGSGIASSVAFTPLKGIEIVTPDAAEIKAVEDGCTTYFSNSSSFVKLEPRT